MSDESFECDKCGREFDSKRGLSIHDTQTHSEEDTKEDKQMTGDNTNTVNTTGNTVDLSLGVKQFASVTFLFGLAFGVSLGLLAGGSASPVQLTEGDVLDQQGAPSVDDTGDTGAAGTVEISTTEFPYDVEFGTGTGQTEWAGGTVDFEGRPYVGSSDAQVDLVSYEDFFCPYCGRHNEESVPQIMTNYVETGQVKYYYKHLPVVGGEDPAIASECALEQSNEAFWVFKYNQFDNLDQLRDLNQNNPGLYDETMVEWAGELGLDTDRFETCYNNRETAQQLQADSNEAQSLGAQATPTIFVNGEEIRGAQPFSAFQEVIESQLA